MVQAEWGRKASSMSCSNNGMLARPSSKLDGTLLDELGLPGTPTQSGKELEDISVPALYHAYSDMMKASWVKARCGRWIGRSARRGIWGI